MTTEPTLENQELLPLPQNYEDILRRSEISEAPNLRELLANSSGLNFQIDNEGWLQIGQNNPTEEIEVIVDDFDVLSMPLSEMCFGSEEDINIMCPPLFAYGVLDDTDPLGDIDLYEDHKKGIKRSLCDIQINDGILVSPKEHPVTKGIDGRKIGYLINKYPSFDFWAYQSIQMVEALKEADPNDPRSVMLARYALHYYSPIMRFFEIPYLIFLLEQNAFRIVDSENYLENFELSKSLNALGGIDEDEREAYLDDYEVEWEKVEQIKRDVLEDFLDANPQFTVDDVEIHVRLKSTLALAQKKHMGRSLLDNVGVIIEINDNALAQLLEIDEELLSKYVGYEKDPEDLIPISGESKNIPDLSEQSRTSRDVGDLLMDSLSKLTSDGKYYMPPLAQEVQNTYPVENRPSHNSNYTAINSNLASTRYEGVIEVRLMHSTGYTYHLLNHPIYKHIHQAVNRKGVDKQNLKKQIISSRHLREVSLGIDPPLYKNRDSEVSGSISWLAARHASNRALFQKDMFYLCSTHGSNTISVSTYNGLAKFANTINASPFVTTNLHPDRKHFSRAYLVCRTMRDTEGKYSRGYYIYDSYGKPLELQVHPSVSLTNADYQLRNFDQVTILHPIDPRDPTIRPIYTVNKILNMGNPMIFLDEEFPGLDVLSRERFIQLITRLRTLADLRIQSLDHTDIQGNKISLEEYAHSAEYQLQMFKILVNQARIYKRFLELFDLYSRELDEIYIDIPDYYLVALSKLNRQQLHSLSEKVFDTDLGTSFAGLLFTNSNRQRSVYLEAVFTILNSTDQNSELHQASLRSILYFMASNYEENETEFQKLLNGFDTEFENADIIFRIAKKYNITVETLEHFLIDLKTNTYKYDVRYNDK